jgi:predicted nucleotidyltransferase
MNIQQALTHLQSRLPGLQAVYLFGSQRTPDANANSDLDLAVLASGAIDPLELWRLAGELADIVGMPVDLIDLCTASTVMQYQILTKGERIWVSGNGAGIFEAYILSEKTALDAARSALLEDIHKDGLIHG